ncbi:NADH:ubiquinone oxidoreductase family protein [Striga asiatica]|uniref:NADH dehydrogenase [ubiquinone] 1 alpha subcomplex subunit 12 n=1 Tax=Striga asiatica TaxID=4170 RepID=A0A5A7RED0_STRAF|nr:NADH:ubiquinone oxidoreductase family protein [Striga asiatica]
MSRLWARIAGLFTSRSFVGMDKAGNRYFTRTEQLDVKEKRWVVFKGEQDPTSVPVEWICWLNGQRKKAPTPEEIAELEARRERLKMNVALLKMEEERKTKGGKATTTSIGKAAGPDLKSFIQQFPTDSEGKTIKPTGSDHVPSGEVSEESQEHKEVPEFIGKQTESSEPTGSGESFRPGTWQPPI